MLPERDEEDEEDEEEQATVKRKAEFRENEFE